MSPSRISRRNALKLTLSATAMMIAASKGLISTAHGASHSVKTQAYKDNLGIQLYSIRQQLLNNAGGAFEKLAGIGYQHVEWFDVTSLDKLAPLAQSHGLPITSAHVLSPYITGNKLMQVVIPNDLNSPEKLIEKLNKFGIKHLVLSYIFDDERQHIDQYKILAEHLNRVGELSKTAGIQLCYHNHDFEFQQLNSQRPFDLVVSELHHDNVKFELDVFWAKYAGLQPDELITSLGERCALLHLKDLKSMPLTLAKNHTPAGQAMFKPVGSGIIDFEQILIAAKQVGVGNVFVEQDHTTGHIFEDVKSSYDYLQTLNIK
jgi:sugar phosphate isomerase/epimerase